jgi:hypothetical protein
MDAGSAADESACLRKAKSCGPDAPTLASSSQEASFLQVSLGMTVANKPVTGESAKETVKTIAQGRPGVPVNLWWLTRVLTILHARLRVQRAPGFPCAL